MTAVVLVLRRYYFKKDMFIRQRRWGTLTFLRFVEEKYVTKERNWCWAWHLVYFLAIGPPK